MQAVLSKLLQEPGVQWVGIVSRDGLCILDAHHRDLARETLAAMTATLMGAAEIALTELGSGLLERVTVEARDLTMIVTGVTPQFLLVTIADRESATEQLMPSVAVAAEGIATSRPGG